MGRVKNFSLHDFIYRIPGFIILGFGLFQAYKIGNHGDDCKADFSGFGISGRSEWVFTFFVVIVGVSVSYFPLVIKLYKTIKGEK